MKQKNEEGKIKVSELIETFRLIETLSSNEYKVEQETKEIMEEMGIKENVKFRKTFKNSYFFPICFDDAIIGVNPMTQSIIYDYMWLGYLRTVFCEGMMGEILDTLHGGERMIEWLQYLIMGEAKG